MDAEHHPRRTRVGGDHLLHSGRQGHLEVVEAVLLAIGDRPVGKKRRKAVLAALEHVVLTAHVQKGVLLAGEAGLRKIFRGGAASYGHRRRVDVQLFRELLVRFADGPGEVFREFRLADGRADSLADVLQVGAVVVFVNLLANALAQIVVIQKLPVRLGGRGEPVRHANAFFLEGRDHLA